MEHMMKKALRGVVFLFVIAVGAPLLFSGILSAAESGGAGPDKIVQSGAIMTVSESKRLIAKAVAQMPIVKNALENGTIIVIKGTTNAYVAEELTGKKSDHAAFVTGRVEPEKAAKYLPQAKAINHLVLVKGQVVDIPLPDAAKKLKAGDVVIKGANALDYKNKTAATNILDPVGGTLGATWPITVARKVHVVIPVGLDKLVAGDVVDLTLKMREPVETLPEPAGGSRSAFPGYNVPSMWLLTGEIVTELEAIKILTGATAFQSSAGGVSGAEGAVWIVFRGTEAQVKKALELTRSIHGEPPYTE
jgi:hypothetical protein